MIYPYDPSGDVPLDSGQGPPLKSDVKGYDDFSEPSVEERSIGEAGFILTNWEDMPDLHFRDSESWQRYIETGNYFLDSYEDFKEIETHDAWELEPENSDTNYVYFLVSKCNNPGQDPNNWLQCKLRVTTDEYIPIEASKFTDMKWEDLPPLYFREHSGYWMHIRKIDYGSEIYPWAPRKKTNHIMAYEAWDYEPQDHDQEYRYLLVSECNNPGQDPANWLHCRLTHDNNQIIKMIKSGVSRKSISDFRKIVKSEFQQDNKESHSSGEDEYLQWKLKDMISHDLDLPAQEILNIQLWMELTYGAKVDFGKLAEDNLPDYHLKRHLKEGCELKDPRYIDDRWVGPDSDFVRFVWKNRSSLHVISTRADLIKVCSAHKVEVSLSTIQRAIKDEATNKKK